MLNPYTDQTFFSFFWVFLRRIWLLASGQASLATDEIQIIVLAGVAISAALVGSFLVLRRMSMLANALSHTILLGIVLVFLLMRGLTGRQDPYQLLSIPALLLAALIAGALTTLLTQLLTRVVKLQEDASIGLVFSILFALGIVLITLFTRNVHIGTELVMGNADALRQGDIKPVLCILGMNMLCFLFLFRGYKATTFDSGLARIFGFSPALFTYLLMMQTSATVISAFRSVGVVMVLAFLVLPPLTARMYFHTLTKLLGAAAAIAAFAAVAGVALSRHIFTCYGAGLSTSGLIVILLGLVYFSAGLLRVLTILRGRAMVQVPDADHSLSSSLAS